MLSVGSARSPPFRLLHFCEVRVKGGLPHPLLLLDKYTELGDIAAFTFLFGSYLTWRAMKTDPLKAGEEKLWVWAVGTGVAAV